MSPLPRAYFYARIIAALVLKPGSVGALPPAAGVRISARAEVVAWSKTSLLHAPVPIRDLRQVAPFLLLDTRRYA